MRLETEAVIVAVRPHGEHGAIVRGVILGTRFAHDVAELLADDGALVLHAQG